MPLARKQRLRYCPTGTTPQRVYTSGTKANRSCAGGGVGCQAHCPICFGVAPNCSDIGPRWSITDRAFFTSLPRTPECIILGLPRALVFPLRSQRGRQIALALQAARQAVLACWGTTGVPDLQAWILRLWHILAMEQLSLAIDTPTKTYAELWAPFLAPPFHGAERVLLSQDSSDS